jgi:hypothetical protein
MPASNAPSRFARVQEVRARHGDALVDRLVAYTKLSDEPADRLIEAFRALPGGPGWRMLDEALVPGAPAPAGAPPELAAFLAPVLEPPAWVDFDLVDAGAVAQWRVGGATQILALTAGSLAFGYQSATLSRPLAATGRLTRMAPRRLGETARWHIAATRPGAMRVGADGLAATVRLRLVHALVRDHLRRDGWDVQAWGQPISIADTIATGIGGFFLVPLRALQDLGVRYTPAELEAIFHQWRWISFVMGAPSECLPAGLAEAQEWVDVALELDPGPSEESADLMRALLFHGVDVARLFPGPLASVARLGVGQLLGGFTRRWMGDELADQLHVPATPLVHLAPLLRPLVRGRDVVRATGVLGSDERVAAVEHALMLRVLGLRGAPPTLAPETVERSPTLAQAA